MAITAPESTGTVTLTIDGREVTAPEGTTIWEAAKAAGIDIPVLCHDERFDPVGVCRMCVVDTGAPAFAASCVRACESGMQVKTGTPEVERSRAMLTRLLMSDQPPRERDPKQTTTGDNELLALADRYGVTQGRRPAVRFRPRRRPVEPGHRGRPRRLHPVRPVRPGLRRHPGQRRDRAQRQGLTARTSRST